MLQQIYNQKLEELNKIKQALEIEAIYKSVTQQTKEETLTISVPKDIKALEISKEEKGIIYMRRYEAIPNNKAFIVVKEKDHNI